MRLGTYEGPDRKNMDRPRGDVNDSRTSVFWLGTEPGRRLWSAGDALHVYETPSKVSVSSAGKYLTSSNSRVSSAGPNFTGGAPMLPRRTRQTERSAILRPPDASIQQPSAGRSRLSTA